MLRALMQKVDRMKEQIGNVSREMENLRKNQKEILEIKKHCKKKKKWRKKKNVKKRKNEHDGIFFFFLMATPAAHESSWARD